MSKCNCKLDFSDLEIELDGKYYIIEGTVYGTHYHIDGCYCLPNGDPGYPSEDEIDIDDIEIEDCYDEDNPDEELSDEIAQKLYKKLNDIDWLDEDDWEDECGYDDVD